MSLTNRPVTPKNVKRTKTSKSERESPWYQYGSDKEYQAWCRKQPSAYSGRKTDIVYAHYRTSDNSGTGIKPPFSGIPLTWEEHTIQHQVGQYNFMPKWQWEIEVEAHLKAWVNSLKK